MEFQVSVVILYGVLIFNDSLVRKDNTYLGLFVEFCFSSCRNLAKGDTGLGAGLVILSITATSIVHG